MDKMFADIILTQSSQTQGLDQNWVPAKKLTLSRAMDIYKEDYMARLTSALGERYEAVWSVLGDELFFDRCKDFIKSYPSTHYDLGAYGDEFPEFIKKMSEFPFLYDLAKFERKFTKLFHSPKTQGASSDYLLTLDNLENHKFEFVDSLDFIYSLYSLTEIWERRKDCARSIEWNIPQGIVLYKTHEEICYKILSKKQYDILYDLYLGQSLGMILNQLDISPEEISDLFNFLGASRIIRS